MINVPPGSRPTSHLAIWYSPFSVGGVEKFLRQFGSHAAGFAVAATRTVDGPMKSRWPADVPVADWTRFGAAFDRTESSAAACRLVSESLFALRPAVVNINDCVEFGLGAAPLLRRLRKHALIIDVLHVDPPGDLLRDRIGYADLLDGVVSSSATALSRLQRTSRLFRKMPGRYIRYGVTPWSGVRLAQESATRLLYVGRLVEEQKRVSRLPALMLALRATGVDARLTVVGDGPDASSLRQAFEEAGLSGMVKFEGFVDPDSTAPYYAGHDLLVNVSDYEGFPISIIEAMAAGCVPLVSDFPSIDRQVMRHGQNCFIVPAAAPEAAAETVRALDRATLGRMSANAVATAKGFTEQRMVEEYQSFLTELGLRRRLEPWPDEPVLQMWEISAANPWLPALTLEGRMRAYRRRLERWIGRDR